MKKYCNVCGKPLDEEGICTNDACPKHKLQMKLKKLRGATQDEDKDKGAKAP